MKAWTIGCFGQTVTGHYAEAIGWKEMKRKTHNEIIISLNCYKYKLGLTTSEHRKLAWAPLVSYLLCCTSVCLFLSQCKVYLISENLLFKLNHQHVKVQNVVGLLSAKFHYSIIVKALYNAKWTLSKHSILYYWIVFIDALTCKQN